MPVSPLETGTRQSPWTRLSSLSLQRHAFRYDSCAHGGQGGPGFEDLILPCADVTSIRKRRQESGTCTSKDKADLRRRLAEANTALMLSTLPESLPCRDEEKRQIQEVLDDFFAQRLSVSLGHQMRDA